MAVKHTKKLFVKALEKKFATEVKTIGAKDAKLEGQTTSYLRLGPEQNARKREFMEAAAKLRASAA
jgi:methyl-coenzyme M reductase alpha subunit